MEMLCLARGIENREKKKRYTHLCAIYYTRYVYRYYIYIYACANIDSIRGIEVGNSLKKPSRYCCR